MSRVQADQELVSSVLDRLIDNEPGVSTEPSAHRSARLAQMKESVKRDLEWLLNCKRSLVAIPAGLGQLHDSLLTYGLPDFTHAGLNRTEELRVLHRAIEAVIRRFEPRLSQVSVTLIEGRQFDRGLRFRIDGVLDLEPTPEAVSFDSVLDLTSKAFLIQPG